MALELSRRHGKNHLYTKKNGVNQASAQNKVHHAQILRGGDLVILFSLEPD